MIKTAFRFQGNMVVVFDGKGEQIPRYQGRYEEVRESILKDAPPGAVFSHRVEHKNKFKVVSREEW